ncbi:MAG: hypothetical protein ABSF95_00490 [Verrucomicrobiota bacterium]
MKISKLIAAICVIVLCILTPIRGNAQASWAAKTARELVEALIQKGGQQGAKELMELGGETLAREALEKAAQEGGEKLAQRLATLTLEHGAALLKVAKQSPSKFVSAFDELTPAMQKAAAQAITREPDLMARLFLKVGKEALTAAAKHPGVGTQVVEVLGREGAEVLSKVTTDEAIQLSRLAPKIAKVAEPERRALMELIGKAPGKIMDLLEQHPHVLRNGTALAAFLASKDQLLDLLLGGKKVGIGPDGKPIILKDGGFIARIVGLFRAPLAGMLGIVGIAIAGWATIKLWATYRVSRAKVKAAEKRISAAQGEERK